MNFLKALLFTSAILVVPTSSNACESTGWTKISRLLVTGSGDLFIYVDNSQLAAVDKTCSEGKQADRVILPTWHGSYERFYSLLLTAFSDKTDVILYFDEALSKCYKKTAPVVAVSARK